MLTCIYSTLNQTRLTRYSWNRLRDRTEDAVVASMMSSKTNIKHAELQSKTQRQSKERYTSIHISLWRTANQDWTASTIIYDIIIFFLFRFHSRPNINLVKVQHSQNGNVKEIGSKKSLFCIFQTVWFWIHYFHQLLVRLITKMK